MVSYSSGVILVWNIASIEASAGHAQQIEPSHFLIALCKFCDLDVQELCGEMSPVDPDLSKELEIEKEILKRYFREFDIETTRFRRLLRKNIFIPAPNHINVEIMHRSPESRNVFRRAELIASIDPVSSHVSPHHLLEALWERTDPLWMDILAGMGNKHLPGRKIIDKAYINPENGEPKKVPGEKHSTPIPFLERFGRDLTSMAREGKLDPLIGRHAELLTLTQTLIQKHKNNAILVGEAGVGKTCIVEGLAQILVSGHAPDMLRSKRIIEIEMAQILAGAKYRGEFEERLEGIIQEASLNADVILFIDEFHTILGAGGEGASNAANILKPALARGDLNFIGSTTLKEFRTYVEKDEALERRFQVIWVDEPTREESIEILNGLKPRFEAHHGITITDDAIQSAIELSNRYLPDLRLPDKAIDLIDQACANARIATFSTGNVNSIYLKIGRDEIARIISRRCQIPLEQLDQDEVQRLIHMESILEQRVMGQEAAIHTISDAIRTAKAGLKKANKPIGVFLFVGSTGTGKTELAKALAEFLFGDEDTLIRIDMSEYKEKHSISKLIGAPPGYIGYEDEGQLIGRVRSKPYSVILFDEIEKAHPEVLDILLQVFDEGVLTDSHGRRTSFRETVIIITSNLGNQTRELVRSIGFFTQPNNQAKELVKSKVLQAIKATLRPELINRITKIIFFDFLDKPSVRSIIDKIIGALQNQLRERKISVHLAESVYEVLMLKGYSPEFGAREMERVINEMIVQPISRAILEGCFTAGKEILVDIQDDKVVLK